jgi:hypothetical protein
VKSKKKTVSFQNQNRRSQKNSSHLAAIDLFGQNADVLDRPRLREPAERRVVPKRLDELHVEDGVGQHGHEAVHERQSEQEFEPAHVLSTQPQRHSPSRLIGASKATIIEREEDDSRVFGICWILSVESVGN